MKRIVALVALLLAVTVMPAALATPVNAHDRASMESAVLNIINKTRSERGLRTLSLQKDLEAAAIGHSRQMLADDYFSHYSAGGASFAERLRVAGYGRSGCSSCSVGEVIGWGKGAGTAQAIFSAWMGSSGHRTVILDKRWRDIGIGCAQGSFGGMSDTLMYTVDFGRRER
jgi:uncharacterized protein YkwD